MRRSAILISLGLSVLANEAVAKTTDSYLFTSEAFDRSGHSDRQQGRFTQVTDRGTKVDTYQITPSWLLDRQTKEGHSIARVSLFVKKPKLSFVRDEASKVMTSSNIPSSSLARLNSGLTANGAHTLPLPSRVGVFHVDQAPDVDIKVGKASGGTTISYAGRFDLLGPQAFKAPVTFGGYSVLTDDYKKVYSAASWTQLNTSDCGMVTAYSSLRNDKGAIALPAVATLKVGATKNACSEIARAYYFALARQLNEIAATYGFGQGEHDTNELPLGFTVIDSLSNKSVSLTESAARRPADQVNDRLAQADQQGIPIPAIPGDQQIGDLPPIAPLPPLPPPISFSATVDSVQDFLGIDAISKRLDAIGVSSDAPLASLNKLYSYMDFEVKDQIAGAVGLDNMEALANATKSLGQYAQEKCAANGGEADDCGSLGGTVQKRSHQALEVARGLGELYLAFRGIPIALDDAALGEAVDCARECTVYAAEISASSAKTLTLIDGALDTVENVSTTVSKLDALGDIRSALLDDESDVENETSFAVNDLTQLSAAESELDQDQDRLDGNLANKTTSDLNELYNERDAQILAAEPLYQQMMASLGDATTGDTSGTDVPQHMTNTGGGTNIAPNGGALANVDITQFVNDPMSLYTGGYADATVVGQPLLAAPTFIGQINIPNAPILGVVASKTGAVLPALEPTPALPAGFTVTSSETSSFPALPTCLCSPGLVVTDDEKAAYLVALANYGNPLATVTTTGTSTVTRPYAAFIGSTLGLTITQSGQAAPANLNLKPGVYDIYANGRGVIVQNAAGGAFDYPNTASGYPQTTNSFSSSSTPTQQVTLETGPYLFTVTKQGNSSSVSTSVTDNGALELLGRLRILSPVPLSHGLGRR